MSRSEQRRVQTLTGVAFAQDLDGRGHLLLADALVLLPLGGGLESLPGQGAQVEVHEDVAQGLQVVTPGLLCRGRGGPSLNKALPVPPTKGPYAQS